MVLASGGTRMARAFAKPTLRPLPLAHRLASSTSSLLNTQRVIVGPRARLFTACAGEAVSRRRPALLAAPWRWR